MSQVQYISKGVTGTELLFFFLLLVVLYKPNLY